MPIPFAAVPLRRFVDDNQWEADDLAGRLSIVAHAAFLSAGFVPYGGAPRSGHLLKHVDEIGPSAPVLTRRYTLPQLARGEGAEVAVLEMRAQGDGDVAFQAYLLTRDGHRRCLCEALLDEAKLSPILSGDLDGVACALETGAVGSWLWKSLADWVCRVLFLQLCRWNDLPMIIDFVSLPDDAKAEILKRLTDGKDLAKVESSSRPLRRLVAERDGELWKAMYETLHLLPEEDEEEEEESLDMPFSSWKERYVRASQQLQRNLSPCWGSLLCPPLDFTAHEYEFLAEAVERHLREREACRLANWSFTLPMEDSFIIDTIEESMEGFYMPPHPPVRDLPASAAAASGVLERSRQFRCKRRQVPQKDHKKCHGAGAIHSPSSRYRWKHR